MTVIKMSEEQGRHGDWAKGVGGEQVGDEWARRLCALRRADEVQTRGK